MKLLTDFDGVLTDLAEEAARVRALFDAEVAEAAASVGRGAAWAALVGRAEADLRARPRDNGWFWNGRITAFADEDPFVRVNALAARLDAWADAGEAAAATLRKAAVARGRTDFRAIAQASYVRMTEETAAGKMHPLDPEAPKLLASLVARGVRVVVVSNSGTERILKILRGAGLEAFAHGAADGPIRVRGDAKKFVLGDAPRTLKCDGYVVDLDRPHYERILREEEPDAVMGDVFSLDLALPLALRRAHVGRFAGARLLLRRRPYTPAWPAGALGEEPSAFIPVESLSDALAPFA